MVFPTYKSPTSNTSVFDQSFRKPTGCFGICNETGNRQTSALQNNRLDDDFKTPADRQKKHEIDDMLSQAMKGLTFEEREEQMHILHGVDQKIAEEETFIETSLQQLESHLANIKSHSVYEMAERMNAAYVRARAFRIMFLRGNRYDVKESAENMLRFFETKLQLFGDKKLVKDITLEDLDEDDIAALKTGFFQLAGKDSSGRILILNMPGLRGNMALKSELRMRYYIMMSVLEKEENQLSGFVPIIYFFGDMKDRFGGSGFFENAAVGAAIPKHNAAMHLCTDDTGQYLLFASILKAVPLKVRSRLRLHFGSQIECLYHLKTFGIPQDFLPLDPNTNQISLKRHLEWVDFRFAREKHGILLPTITPIIYPFENDILVGTGKQSNNMGNQLLRLKVKELSQAYDKGSREARKELVDSVINSVQESGGRFLQVNDHQGEFEDVWKEMPKKHIRKIVSQAFRNSYRRRSRSATCGDN